MTSNLEISGTYTGSSSARTQRSAESARHGGWMLELERALLALNANKGETQRNEPDNDNENDRPAVDTQGEVTGVNNASRPLAENMSRDMSLDNPASARAHSAGETNASETASAWILKREGGMVQAAGMGAQEPMDGTAVVQDSYHSCSSVISNAVVTQMRQERSAVETEGASQMDISARPAVDAKAALWFSRLPAAANSTMSSPSEDSFSADTPDSTPQPADLTEDTQPYAQRQLHLYHGKDGVHAWIRDADLLEFQARSIAAALSNELSSSGLKLAALTLNGKKVASLFENSPTSKADPPVTMSEQQQETSIRKQK